MIRTGLLDVGFLKDPQMYAAYRNKIPLFRKEKADRIKFMEDKALSVGAWLLFDSMKKKYGIEGECVYNLSHSGRYALCSLEDNIANGIKIGCDVECIKGYRAKIAERFFCDFETQFIKEMASEKERAEAFYRFWVLKESFMKAVRLGMKLDMRSFEVRFDKEEKAYLRKQPLHIKETFYYKEYEIKAADAKIAVCSNRNDFDHELGIWQYECGDI